MVFYMAPNGHGKGKQLAAKQPVPRPAVAAVLDSDDEENAANRQFVLDQLAALERARGLSPGGPLMGAVISGDQSRSLNARQHYEAEVHNRVSFVVM